MYKEILDRIKEYDKISIFRHERPDGDCMFSALAMETFIKDNFPLKEIKIAGKDTYDLISRNDELSDSYIKSSLAIILDTSNSERIDDGRALNAEYRIKIDHHPLKDNYGDINIIEPKASACAEILAKIFLSRDFKDLILSKQVCEYLYSGIVSDTINFRTTNVTASTLSTASKLVRRGDLNISKIVEFVMDKNLDDFKKSSKVVARLQTKGSFGFIILDQNDMKKIDISKPQAKNNIDEIGRIKELNVWSIAIETSDGLYDCSARSKEGFVVNEVCAQFGGGGHKNAAAAKKLNMEDLRSFLSKLERIANQN